MGERNDPHLVKFSKNNNSYVKNGPPTDESVEATIPYPSPVYESLPNSDHRGSNRPNNDLKETVTVSSPGGQHERVSISDDELLARSNPVYGSSAVPAIARTNAPGKKKPFKDRRRNERRKSGLCLYGLVILIMAVILVISVAALVLSLFLLLGVVDTPTNKEIQALKTSLADLQQQIMSSSNSSRSTASPATSTMPTSVSLGNMMPITVVNYSECEENRVSQSLTEGSTSNQALVAIPEFLNSTQERTKVVVEQSCWVSNIQNNPAKLHASLRSVNFGQDLYGCYCSKETAMGSAECNIYVRECSLTTVYVSVS